MDVLQLVDDWDVPHVGVSVVGRDGVVGSRGATSREFPVASVTKLLTAYAIMIGVEEGAVDLDEPAGPAGATLRHLLAHTAGYGFDSDAKVIAPPATRRIYSNRGVEEAARHLVVATGIGFPDYLAEAVLQPLGMVSTRLTGSAAVDATSTVEDLTRFTAELLAPRLVSPGGLAEMVRVQFPGLLGVLPGHGRYDPLDWGLGFERNFGRPGHWGGGCVSAGTYGHFGGTGTFLWVDPRPGLGCVCLTDREFGPWAQQAWPALSDAVCRAGTD